MLQHSEIGTPVKEITHSLASGQFDDLGYDEAVERILDGSIFDYLGTRMGISVPLSILTPIDRLELLYEWEQFIGCLEPFRFNAHRKGLCLILGYILEGIQQRSTSPRYRLTDELPTTDNIGRGRMW